MKVQRADAPTIRAFPDPFGGSSRPFEVPSARDVLGLARKVEALNATSTSARTRRLGVQCLP